MKEAHALTLATTTKLILAALLVAAPATVSIAAYTGTLDLPFVASLSENEASPFGGTVIAEFGETFEEPVTTGSLDLRIDDGAVRVIGWEQNALLVLVLQTEDDAALSDLETTVAHEHTFVDGHLDLSVVVDRDGTYGYSLSVEDRSAGAAKVERAIVAFVPQAATYESIFACSGQAGMLAGAAEALSSVSDLLFGSEKHPAPAACVEQDTTPSLTPHITINRQNGQGLNVTFGLEQIKASEAVLSARYADMVVRGSELGALDALTYYGDVLVADSTTTTTTVWTDYGDIVLARSDASEAALTTDYGDVGLEGSYGTLDVTTDYGDIALVGDTTEATLRTHYGDVFVQGTITRATVTSDYGDLAVAGVLDAGKLTTDYGDILLDLDVERSGAHALTTNYGDIQVQLTQGPVYGYDVLAGTNYGDITLAIEDADVEENDARDRDSDWEWDDPSSWFGAHGEYQQEARAVTHGFEERSIQVSLVATTNDGRILVTDGSLFAQEEDDDESHPVSPVQPGILASLV